MSLIFILCYCPEVGRHVGRANTSKAVKNGKVRSYMEGYSQESNQITALLELEKLDSEMIQSLHQTELDEIIITMFTISFFS
jgi:hypothetical protein